MKEIFEQYGAAIITVIVIVALAAVITFLLGSGEVVEGAFSDLITRFFAEVNGTT